MTDFTKANIRMDKIRTRGMKKSYKGWNKDETRLLKLHFEWQDMSRQLDKWWRYAKYNKNKTVSQENNFEMKNWTIAISCAVMLVIIVAVLILLATLYPYAMISIVTGFVLVYLSLFIKEFLDRRGKK